MKASQPIDSKLAGVSSKRKDKIEGTGAIEVRSMETEPPPES